MWRGCVSAGMSVHILTDLREFFFKGGRTGLRCIHVLRVPGSFTHQVSWSTSFSVLVLFYSLLLVQMQFGQSSQGFQPLVQRHDLQADEAGHQQKQHHPGNKHRSLSAK